MSQHAGERLVGMGAYAVAKDGATLGAVGLGSCVAVMLSDPVARVGGLLHVLLPSQSSRRGGSPARSADTGVPLLLEELLTLGADRTRVRARLVGGATMFGDLMPAGSVSIGERNQVACRSALRDLGIPVIAEDVGGGRGRSVHLDVTADIVTVRSVGGASRTI